jgi:hypothetical protein
MASTKGVTWPITNGRRQNRPPVVGTLNLRNGQFKEGDGDWFIAIFFLPLHLPNNFIFILFVIL